MDKIRNLLQTARGLKGLTHKLLDKGDPDLQAKCEAPSLVLVVPLLTTKEEEEACKKIDLQGEMRSAIIHEDLLSDIPSYLAAKTLAEARTEAVELILRILHPSQGFDVKLFTSCDRDEIFVCLRMSDANALKVCDNCNYPLQMDLSALQKLHIDLSGTNFDVVPAYVKFSHQYTDYLKEYAMETGTFSHLRQVDHIRVLYDLITDHIDIKTWQREGVIKSLIANHSRPKLQKLVYNWGSWRLLFTLRQPLDEIRDYFGEEITFYFAFVQFSVKGLMFVLPFCLSIKVYEVYYLCVSWDDTARIAYSMFLIIWATIFIELWKRQEKILANRWGQDVTDHSTVKDQENVNFKGVVHPWEGDRNVKVVLPHAKQAKIGKIISWVTSGFFMLMAIGLVALILFLRGEMRASGNANAALICGLLLSLQIKVIDKVWNGLSMKLTVMERHRLEKDFNQSRSQKLLLVKFPNTFSGFFYIAFIQEFLEGCPEQGCMALLRTNMITVFTVYTVVGMADVILPFIKMQTALNEERREAQEKGIHLKELGMLELQGKMEQYTLNDLATDYADIMFPLYFIMIFGLAFPLAPFITVLAFLIQIRADAWKLLHTCQRPFPERAEGIGQWRLKVLEAVGYLSVFANWGLIVFQCEPFKSYHTTTRLLCFFVGEQMLIVFKQFMGEVVIPDYPESVRLNRVRQAHQAQKLFGALVSEENLKAVPLREKPQLAAYPGLSPSDPYFEEPMIAHHD